MALQNFVDLLEEKRQEIEEGKKREKDYYDEIISLLLGAKLKFKEVSSSTLFELKEEDIDQLIKKLFAETVHTFDLDKSPPGAFFVDDSDRVLVVGKWKVSFSLRGETGVGYCIDPAPATRSVSIVS